METKTGFTPIDTYYELQGFKVAEGFYTQFFGFFFVFLAGASLVYLLMKKDRSTREVVQYLLYVVVALFLVSPVETKINMPEYAKTAQEFFQHLEDGGRKGPVVKAPRAMVLMHYLVDTMVRIAIKETQISIGDRYAPERLNALLRRSRIYNQHLALRYRLFLAACYVPAVGLSQKHFDQEHPGGLNPFSPAGETAQLYQTLNAVDEDGNELKRRGQVVSCAQWQGEIQSDLGRHIRTESAHRETLAEMARVQNYYGYKGTSNWKVTRDHSEFLFNVVVSNESRAFFELQSQTRELTALSNAVPEYNIFKAGQQALSNPQHWWQWVKSVASWVVRALQSFDQWFKHHGEVAAAYYKVVNYTPYMYGLSMMIILSVFPVAACVSVLPFGWRALLKWGKCLLWVKLWLVFWTMLSEFNKARYQWNDDLGQEAVHEDVSYIFAGIAAMYLVAPGLALIAVHLLDAAARSGISAAAAGLGGSGGGAGGFWQHAQHGQTVANAAQGDGGAGAQGGAGEAAGGAAAGGGARGAAVVVAG